MQLILLLLLLLSGSPDLKNFAPLLDGISSEEEGGLGDVLKGAEQLAQLASAFSSDNIPRPTANANKIEEVAPADGGAPPVFPLAPVSAIADGAIAGCLSRYISVGE